MSILSFIEEEIQKVLENFESKQKFLENIEKSLTQMTFERDQAVQELMHLKVQHDTFVSVKKKASEGQEVSVKEETTEENQTAAVEDMSSEESQGQ